MVHLLTFFGEFFWTIFFLLLFGFAGGFLIAPFRQKIQYPLLAAPFAGLLITALGIAISYTLLGLSLFVSSLITLFFCCLLTFITLYPLKLKLPRVHFLLCLFIVGWSALLVFWCNATTIHFAHPGFLFSDGTDHVGYVQLADWLRAHTIHQTPTLSPQLPYQSWPYQMFHFDPRFGSFYLLSMMGTLKQLPSLFVYNFAVGVIVIAGIFAVSAVFAKKTSTLILAIIGLTCCQWYPLGQRGYFGKILAFPSAFFITGLFFSLRKKISTAGFSSLIFLTAAAAICYPATAITLVFVLLTLGYFVFDTVCQKSLPQSLGDYALLFSVIALISLSMNGQLSHPFSGLGGEQRDWLILWKQLFNISLSRSHYFLSVPVSTYLLSIALIVLLIMIVVGFLTKEAVALSLLVFPILFLLYLTAFPSSGHCWIAYQLIGVLFPAMLLGMLSLCHQKRYTTLILICIIVTIGLRIPKLMEAKHHYAGHGVLPDRQYSQVDMDTLSEKIGNHLVFIDITDTPHALPLLAEFGRRDIAMTWTTPAWAAIVGYQKWPAPKTQPAVFHLTGLKKQVGNCLCVYQTQQYQLWQCYAHRI